MAEKQAEVLKAFGQWVKNRREARKLTQGDAASRADISRIHWVKIEAGQTGIKRKTAESLAKALGVSAIEVLHHAGFRVESPTEVSPTWLEFQALPEEAQEMVAAQISALRQMYADREAAEQVAKKKPGKK